MKVSYNWLQSYFDKPLPPPEKLAELFNLHFAEVEGLNKEGADTVIEVKTLADRNHYALSHRGVAVEASAIAGIALKPVQSRKIGLDASISKVPVIVDDSKLCPRYVARRIEGVNAGASPKWLSERLEAIGARSINSIVDATNYVMFDLGQPLHAFDADKVKGAIHVRKAEKGEKITLLDGREIDLLESDLLIADDLGPLVIAGVKGGKRAEVTESTRSIIIESANFNPTAVRRTSTRANIRNDSSKRFENEISPSLAEEAMEKVTALILEISKEAKAGATTDVYPSPVKPWTIEVLPERINSVSGLDLKASEMADILKRLQCEVKESSGKLFVTPPLARLDLVIPEDIADEVVRMYGYDKLSSRDTPNVSATPVDKTFYWSEKVKNVLSGLGFSETLLYTLVPKGAFEISYPLASDKAALREKISPKLQESLAMNARNAELLGLETVKIFEIGKVFPKSGEKTSLCIGVFQVKKKKGVTSESILRSALASLEAELGVKIGSKIENVPAGAFIEADFDALFPELPKNASIGDLGFEALPPDKRYSPFSPYPFIVRDVALFVPSGTSDGEVSGVIKSAALKAAENLLVKGPDLFDRFEKDGKVSYAFRMIFQSFEKTLSDEDANGFMVRVYEAAKAKGWEVR